MIPYMIGKLAPKSSHLTRGLVKYAPGRGYFRVVPSQNGDKYVTSPPSPIVELVIHNLILHLYIMGGDLVFLYDILHNGVPECDVLRS